MTPANEQTKQEIREMLEELNDSDQLHLETIHYLLKQYIELKEGRI